MPNVDTALKNWSSTASSNQPDSSDAATVQADLQQIQATVRQALGERSDLASATTTDLGSLNNGIINVTGTTTITGFGTCSAGILKVVTFAGALTLTHNATSLILPGAVNITTYAGLSLLAESLGSGNWKVHLLSCVIAPTRQVLTSGTSATYTTPAGVRQLRVRMKGGGGGGSGGGTGGSPTSGSSGGTTTFNSIDANGGGGGVYTDWIPGAGGTAGAGSASVRIPGAPGGISSNNTAAYAGGCGGGHGGGRSNGAGASAVNAGVANSGGGGAGGGVASTSLTGVGNGGGEGEYVELVINSPAATYTYTVGAGGAAGNAGTSGAAGAAGGSGIIIVDELY